MVDSVGRLNAALQGRYRIERELGEGGMAKVYLADDLRHERKVALKVLKPELAAVLGAERFLAEIKTTAGLQHPHILPLHDSGEADGFLFYVMPYIEGETLRGRIDREKQLPVEEAVRIAAAVANALHTAHERGIVHRDIKPGNILLSRGEPLVADFGIALAVGAAGGSRLTETGLSVGTPYYMSPEQATGDQTIGPPSDIYALACVLYEMLTGEPPYLGNSAQAVLGRIIQGAPVSAAAVRKSIPLNVDAAIRKGLEKLPADRFTSAHEFARALLDPSFRHGVAEDAVAVLGRRALVGYAGWGVAAVLTGILAWGATRPAPSIRVERFSMPFEPDQEMTLTGQASFNLSPDGSTLVYRHRTEQGQVLMLRRWDELLATPVRETVGAQMPSISPDGERLAFVQGTQVQVLALAGGPVVTLGEGFYPTWGPDGYVYMAVEQAPGARSMVRIPATGGPSEPLTTVGEGEAVHIPSDVLPGGESMLFMAILDGPTFEMRGVDVRSGETTSLGAGERPSYAATGHLLYIADGTLMAAPFDPARVEVTGPAVAMVDSVGAYALSDTGKLFYTTGTGGGTAMRQLVWVTRSGEVTPVDPAWTYDMGDSNQGWSVSPDGRRLALRERTEDGFDIWVKQLDRGPRSRLTADPGDDRKPVWAPDGRTITFVSTRSGDFDVWSQPADGTGEPRLLHDFAAPGVAQAAWSPDGEWLVLRTLGTGGVEGGRDLYVVRPGVDSTATPLIATEFDEVEPDISPDGRWITYTSSETGRYEVYVRPFPDVNEGRWQISVQGGFSPKWSRDGREITFMDANRALVAVDVRGGAEFEYGSPRTLFALPRDIQPTDITLQYDVAPDGRFVMSRVPGVSEDPEDPPGVILVNNFFEELRARVPRP